MGVLETIVIFLLVLGVLVYVHEFGHFIAAKRGGIRVDEFGFGFPPRIWGKEYKGTLYSINWIPLGGFVKIKGVAGDDPEVEGSKHDDDSFATKSYPRRLLILFAGIGMNIVLAAVLYSIVFMFGISADPQSVESGGTVHEQQVMLSSVLDESPAAIEGLQPGDVVVSVNGESVETTEDFQSLVSRDDAVNTEYAVEVLRGEEALSVVVESEKLTFGDEEFVGIGVGLQGTARVSYPWYQAIWLGVKTTLSTIVLIFVSLVNLLQDLLIQGEVSDDLSGPIGIAVLTGQVAESGFIHLLQFTAILSINLAIFNLLPLPALDGGRILFVLIEMVRRKPVDQKIEAVVHNIGFILLLLLVLLVTLKDVAQYNVFGFLLG